MNSDVIDLHPSIRAAEFYEEDIVSCHLSRLVSTETATERREL